MGAAGVQEAQANKDRASAITGAIGGVASGAGSFAGGYAKKAGMENFVGSGGASDFSSALNFQMPKIGSN